MLAPAPLRLDQVHQQYPVARGRVVRAVAGVSLEIVPGEIVGIVGESGCGKSTLLRLASLFERPTAGAVHIAGRDVSAGTRADRAWARAHVQVVLQDPSEALDPRLTVGRSVEEPLTVQWRGRSRAERRARVEECLAMVGLDAGVVDRYPGQFSGGQRQRLAIARALTVHPDLLLLDEPTASLDVSLRAQVLTLVGELRETAGVTVVMVTHDLHSAVAVCDRIVVMYLGKVVETLAAAEVAERRHPYTRALWDSLPTVGSGYSGRALTGEVPDPIDPPSGCVFRTRCELAEPRCAEVEPVLVPTPSGTAACHVVAPATPVALTTTPQSEGSP